MNKLNCKFFIFICAILFFCTNAYLKDSLAISNFSFNKVKTAKAVAIIIKEYKAIKSYSADFEFLDEGRIIDKGQIFYKANPDRKKMLSSYGATKDKKSLRIYFENHEIWYLPAEKIVYNKKRLETKKLKPDSLSKILEYIDSNNTNLIEENLKEGFYIFEAYFPVPTEPFSNEVPVRSLTRCNAKYGYVENIKIFNKDNKLLTEQIFKNYKLNIPIDDNEFIFTPPSDTQIVNWDAETGLVGPVRIEGTRKDK